MFYEVVGFCGYAAAPVAGWISLEYEGPVGSVCGVCCSLWHVCVPVGGGVCMLLPPLLRCGCSRVLCWVLGFVFPTVQTMWVLVAGHVREVDTIRICDV